VAGYGSRCKFLPERRVGWMVLTNVDDQALPKAIRELICLELLIAKLFQVHHVTQVASFANPR